MTSSKNHNSPAPKRFVPKHLIPNLSEDVKKDTTDGIYGVGVPKEHAFDMPYHNENDDGTIPAIQLRCQSLFTKTPDTVCKCNQVVKTIVGKGSGDQTEIVSCGKCRTSYLIRTTYDEDGNPTVTSSIWEMGRNIQNYCDVKRDKDYNVWLKFNKEEDE